MPDSNDPMHAASALRKPSDGSVAAGPAHIKLDNHTKQFMKRYRTELSASTASLLSTLTAYPLDSVKTRMQAYRFPNFMACVRHTYTTEGVHGFWRGVLAPLASITLVRTVSFSIYQHAKYTYDDWIFRATGKSPLVRANTKDALPSFGTIACFSAAGATSGGLITIISCPFELTKLSAQISVLMKHGDGQAHSMSDPPMQKAPTATSKPTVAPNTAHVPKSDPAPAPVPSTPKKDPKASVRKERPPGTLTTLRWIVQNRGFMGLYSGFHLHLLRDTIGTAIYFVTYESSKQMLANARGNEPTSPAAVVVAGGLCGLVSWACIYPIDSAKSIYQRNVLTAAADHHPPRVKIEFFNRRMYRGLGVSMVRSCLINAIFFSAFEMIKKQVNKLELDDEN